MRAAAFVATLMLVYLAVACVQPPRAQGLAYPDVGKKHWALKYIGWVSNQQVGGQRLLDDFGGRSYKPSDPLTRAQLARALVLASRRQDESFAPVTLNDVPASHPYYRYIQLALKLRLMGKAGSNFLPNSAALVWQVDRSAVFLTRLTHPNQDWSMLQTLDPARWRPNPGWSTRAPVYFASEVAARSLGFRFNHPYGQEKLEQFPTEPIRRDEAAYTFYQALRVSDWQVYSLRRFNSVKLLTLSDRQKEILTFAFQYEGYPFVYAGEFPTPNSPYGRQDHGGFDCSGFTWWVMKIHFKYPIPIGERSAAQMAASARPRIPRAKLQPGDLIFFASNGPKSAAADVYHAALYIGNGWFFHSTGSTDGVSLASLDWQSWSWHNDFAWGRRLLKASELPAPPSPSPSTSPSTSLTASPSPTPSATSTR